MLVLVLAIVGGCSSSPSLQDKQAFLAQRISVYVSHHDTLPKSLGQLNDVVPDEKRGEWDAIIERMTVDSWGNVITYTVTDQGTKYELRSAGPDGAPNTGDDVVLTGPDVPFETVDK